MNISKKVYWGFLTPVLFCFIFVVVIPFFIGVMYSFSDWNGISMHYNFIGFQNYINAFSDHDFLRAIVLTITYSVVSVVIVNILGMILAVMVTAKVKFSNFGRASFFFPNLIGGLILGFTWYFIFSEGFSYIGNTILSNPDSAIFFNWLSEPKSAFFAMIFVNAWSMSGYVMLIYIAALESVPGQVIEAAIVDGASQFIVFFKVKLPLILSSVSVGLFVTMANTLKIYDLNLSLTAGGPYGKTELLTMNIYNEAFVNSKFGLAQSKAIIFLLIIFVITLLQLKFTQSKVGD